MTLLPPSVEKSFVAIQKTSETQYASFIVPVPSLDLEIIIACGYRRCLDLDGQDGAGQDFLAVYTGQGFVVGLVADGVSQSFFGDIAAQQVGSFLIDLLWENRAKPPESDQLKRVLAELAEKVRATVVDRPLAGPPLVLKALARTRQEGSQTVFSAFIYDGTARNLVVYQVGDTLAWVHGTLNRNPELLPVNPGRWSSNGMQHLALERITRSDVVGLVVHSDGLRKKWVQELGRPCFSETDFLGEVHEQAGVDDISCVSLGLRHIQPVSPAIHKVENGRKPEASARPLPSPSIGRRRKLQIAGFIFVAFLSGLWTGSGLWGKRGVNRPSRVVSKRMAQSPLLVKVKAKKLTQIEFLKRYGNVLPDSFNDPSQRKEGEIIARFSVRGVGFARAEILGPKESTEKSSVSQPETVFFARILGQADQVTAMREGSGKVRNRLSPVVIQLKDNQGQVVYKGTLRLQGRQSSVTKDPFLGYYEIVLDRISNQHP